MKFKYLVESCSAKHGKITKREAEDIIRDIFIDITDALINGESITIKNFGRFETVIKAEKIVKEPRQGRLIKIPQKIYPKFIPSPTLKGAVSGSLEDN